MEKPDLIVSQLGGLKPPANASIMVERARFSLSRLSRRKFYILRAMHFATAFPALALLANQQIPMDNMGDVIFPHMGDSQWGNGRRGIDKWGKRFSALY